MEIVLKAGDLIKVILSTGEKATGRIELVRIGENQYTIELILEKIVKIEE